MRRDRSVIRVSVMQVSRAETCDPGLRYWVHLLTVDGRGKHVDSGEKEAKGMRKCAHSFGVGMQSLNLTQRQGLGLNASSISRGIDSYPFGASWLLGSGRLRGRRPAA